jgi:hypothetical protein
VVEENCRSTSSGPQKCLRLHQKGAQAPKSAQQTSESSPALDCWHSQSAATWPVKRATESMIVELLNDKSSRPFHGLRTVVVRDPQHSSAGLLSLVRFAD